MSVKIGQRYRCKSTGAIYIAEDTDHWEGAAMSQYELVPPELKPGDVITDPAQIKVGMRLRSEYQGRWTVFTVTDTHGSEVVGNIAETSDLREPGSRHASTVGHYDVRITYLGRPKCRACGLQRGGETPGLVAVGNEWRCPDGATCKAPKPVTLGEGLAMNMMSPPPMKLDDTEKQAVGLTTCGIEEQVCVATKWNTDALRDPPAPSDPWGEHLRQEKRIANEMREKNLVHRVAVIMREKANAREHTVGPIAPGTNGLGGLACRMTGVVGVDRRKR